MPQKAMKVKLTTTPFFSIVTIVILVVGGPILLNGLLMLGLARVNGGRFSGFNACEEKALTHHQLIRKKTLYELSSTAQIGKGLVLHVEDWGRFYYRYPKIGNDEIKKKCEGVSLVEEKTDERPASNGTIISIGQNLNRGYEPIVTFTIDLYAYADSTIDEPYDFEHVIQEIANRYTLVPDPHGDLRLVYRPIKPSDDQSRGTFIFHTYNGQSIRDDQSVELVSTDSGANWQVKTEPKTLETPSLRSTGTKFRIF